jgi:hypothetical protein
MTPCRTEKVDFSKKIEKNKKNKNRITKKQIDRKNHQKNRKKQKKIKTAENAGFNFFFLVFSLVLVF